MFRTLVVNSGEKLSIENNWLVVSTGEESSRIPIEDLYSVVIDNQKTLITVPTIHRLTDVGVHLLICNEKHQPVSVILPQNTHYKPLSVIRKQLSLDSDFKDMLWDKIIKWKIRNQAKVLSLCGGSREKVNRLTELSEEVINGDEGNREGISAKMFFREMYGSEFVRMHDDGINHALNYGYTVIRSAFCKTLCAYGYNCVLGIHHINESNPFNLADDLMEPLRPVVDMWVDDNHEDLLDMLSRDQKNALACIINNDTLWNGKRMRMRNAIDRYVASLTTAIDKRNVDCLIIPEIVRNNYYPADDD